MIGRAPDCAVVASDPSAIVPFTRDVIYLESGYLWLFWVGGIPLVLAFLWLLRNGFRLTRQVASTRADDVGVAAVAARAALWCLLILSLIDPHLTLRGGADLFFCLLGLAANLNVPITHPDKPDLAPPDLQVVRALPSGASDASPRPSSGP